MLSLSVGSEHVYEVLTYVEDRGLVPRWRRIGVQLKLTYADLEIIESNKAGEENRTMAMLHQWLISSRATKQALVDALRRIK